MTAADFAPAAPWLALLALAAWALVLAGVQLLDQGRTL